MKLICLLVSCAISGSLHATEVSEIYRASDYGALVDFNPGRMALDSEGNLFFAVGSGEILKATPEGILEVFLPPIGSGDRVLESTDFLVIDSADNLYVGGALTRDVAFDSTVVTVFRVNPRGHIREIFTTESNPEDLDIRVISGAAVDDEGNVFISGYLSDSVVRIGANGGATELLRGPFLSGNIPFERPRSLTIDSSNNLYVTASRSSNVIRVFPSGEIQELLKKDDPEYPDNYFSSPSGIAINQYGEIFVSSVEPYVGAVIIYPDGNISKVISESGDGTGYITQYGSFGHIEHGLEFIGEPLIGSGQAAAGPDGSFYVVGAYSDNLFRIGRNGSVVAILGRSVYPDILIDHPQFVVVTPENEIFVSAIRSRNIVKVEMGELGGGGNGNGNNNSIVDSVTDTFNEYPDNARYPVMRFYNTRDNAFFYTRSATEADMIIANSSSTNTAENRWPYIFQGSTFSAAHSYPGSVPLHRFFNYRTGHHFFTASESELGFVMQKIDQNDWPFIYEGVAFQVYASDPTPGVYGKEVPVYRFYSYVFNRHFFTASEPEAALMLQDKDWDYEGIAYYGESH